MTIIEIGNQFFFTKKCESSLSYNGYLPSSLKALVCFNLFNNFHAYRNFKDIENVPLIGRSNSTNWWRFLLFFDGTNAPLALVTSGDSHSKHVFLQIMSFIARNF